MSWKKKLVYSPKVDEQGARFFLRLKEGSSIPERATDASSTEESFSSKGHLS